MSKMIKNFRLLLVLPCSLFPTLNTAFSITPYPGLLHPRAQRATVALSRRDVQGLNITGSAYDKKADGNVTSNRIQISLPGDDNSTFSLTNGFECLSNFYNRGCWEVLGMNEWLTKWVCHTQRMRILPSTKHCPFSVAITSISTPSSQSCRIRGHRKIQITVDLFSALVRSISLLHSPIS